jgi:hypothetical protein
VPVNSAISINNRNIGIARQNTGETQRTQGLGNARALEWAPRGAAERDLRRVGQAKKRQRLRRALASASEKPIRFGVTQTNAALGTKLLEFSALTMTRVIELARVS